MADIASNLVGHWPLQDNAASSTVVALAGSNGTLKTNASNPGDTDQRDVSDGPGGPYPSAMAFFDDTWHVDLGNQAALGFDANDEFTIAAWVRQHDAADAGYLFNFESSSSGYGLRFYGDGTVAITEETSKGPTSNAVFGGDEDVWVHVGATWDLSRNAVFYRNGVAVGGDTGGYFDAPASLSAAIGVRRSFLSETQELDADAADVRVYARALSADDMLAIYRLVVPASNAFTCLSNALKPSIQPSISSILR